MIKSVKVFGTAIRGEVDTGGWVSIVGSAGKEEWRGDDFDDEPPPPQMMLITDMVLAWDPEFRPVLEEYAEDEDLLRTDFGNAFKKLTELGFTEFPEPIAKRAPE